MYVVMGVIGCMGVVVVWVLIDVGVLVCVVVCD